ncbi:MAG: LPS assembly lipoprotein LptE [Gammaproteobacteria bacterium]|nr:LPS assembly lipoprotein LptE [Gammaproteobacteria bacterium]
MKRLSIPRLLIVFALVPALAGCGFQLRGKVDLPQSVSRVNIQGGEPELRQRVEELLRFSGGELVSSAREATAVLRLRDTDYRREVSTVDSRGKATGYNLIYAVSFDLTSRTGSKLLNSQRVQSRRDYRFDSGQVLQGESEERILREDLEKDIAQQIVRRLSTVRG